MQRSEQQPATENNGALSDELLRASALAGRYLGQTLRLMVGLNDYQGYLAHMAQAHPGEPVMSYEQFFRERQDARYQSGKQGGCC